MRIVQIDTGKSWRGTQKQIWLLSRELSQRRQMDNWVIGHPNTPLVHRTRQSGIPTLEVPIRSEVDFIAFGRYYRLLRALKPTVVNIHSSRALLPAGWAARLAKVPLTLFWRCMDYSINDPWRRWKYRQAHDAIIAVSRRVAEVLLEGGIPREIIHVIPIWIDVEGSTVYPREQARQLLGLPPDSFVVGTTAFLVRRKQVDVLIRAFSLLNDRPKARLVVVGDGPERASLERLVRQLGLSAQVHFAGFRADASALMSAFDVFVLPSRLEAAGVVLLEAGLARLPVIIARAGGMMEYVIEGETGLAFEAGNERELAQRIEQVWHDPVQARHWALAHYQRVVREYDVRRIVDRVLTLSTNLLKVASFPAQ